MNSHCFKLHRSYTFSFNLSTVGEIFWGWIRKGPYLSFEKEKETFCVVFTYFTKRGHETTKFHEAVVQRRLRNVQKKKKNVLHVQSCYFADLNLLFFSRSCCRRRRRCLVVNLRNRTGEERRRQTLCDKRDNNFAFALLPPNFTFLWTDLFVEEKETSILSEFSTKHASNSPVTFVTLKRFAVLFFPPSCCVNSLISIVVIHKFYYHGNLTSHQSPLYWQAYLSGSRLVDQNTRLKFLQNR